MRRLWILMAAVMAFGALAVVAPAVGAAVPSASSTKFCKAVQNIGDSGSSLSTGASAKKLAKEFKAAAKSAPKKTKAAMNRIAGFIGALGNSDASELAKVYTSKGFKHYMTDIGTYAGAVAACSS